MKSTQSLSTLMMFSKQEESILWFIIKIKGKERFKPSSKRRDYEDLTTEFTQTCNKLRILPLKSRENTVRFMWFVLKMKDSRSKISSTNIL